MTITLTTRQQAWLEAQVAAGLIPSVEDAVRAAVTEMMAIEQDDLAWARPLVEEARDAVARGEYVEAADVFAALDEHYGRTDRQ